MAGLKAASDAPLSRWRGCLNFRRSLPRRDLCGLLLTVLGLAVLCSCQVGCGGAAGDTAQLDAETRIRRLLQLYQLYVRKNKKGPANEQDLRDFAQKLSTKEREDNAIGDDLESIFISPRDNQKFGIQYNLRLDASATRAVAWEISSQNGLRYVALSNGYPTQCDDETFQQYKK